MAVLLVALILFGVMAYIRLAPSDPALWNVDPGPVPILSGAGPVQPVPGGARATLLLAGRDPAEVLARLDALARATSRTSRLAGSPEQGRMTWITRSAVFGFPDYTTAAVRSEGAATRLDLYARQRFGQGDFGVNGARLRDWIAGLTP